MDEDKVAGHIGTGGYGDLDPARDVERWERLVSRIEVAARPELARRVGDRTPSADPSLLGMLDRWRRGGLLTAGLVAAAASAVFLLVERPAVDAEVALLHPADAVIPDMGEWLRTGEAPSVLALLDTFGEGS